MKKFKFVEIKGIREKLIKEDGIWVYKNHYCECKRGCGRRISFPTNKNTLANHKFNGVPKHATSESAVYLGTHIAERVLSKVFTNVKRMPYSNPGFDFICRNGYKIDVKCSCLHRDDYKGYWQFTIRKNKVADYFLLLAFDNRKDLNPKHIWLIKGTDSWGIIRNYPVNEHTLISLHNTKNSLKSCEEYEKKDKIKNVVACCNNIKIKSKDHKPAKEKNV
jgi:hypothetical protein